MSGPRTGRKLPGLASILLRIALPPAELDAIAGDLEEVTRDRTRLPRLRAVVSATAIALEYGAHRLRTRREQELVSGARTLSLGTLVDDISLAIKSVKRAPAVTIVVAVTLGLGIGANATMFRIVDRLLLSPPEHVVEPERVHRILVERDDGRGGERSLSGWLTYPDFTDLSEADGFVTAGYSSAPVIVGRGPGAQEALSGWASASFFPLLGVAPHLGRFFAVEEDEIGAAPVAVLGYGLWRSRFAGDPDVLGRTIRVRGSEFTIVGVAPPGFTGINLQTIDVWLPLHVAGELFDGDGWVGNRGWYWFQAVARVADGSAPETAMAEATTLHRAGRAEYIEQGRWDAEAEIVFGNLIAARGPQASAASRVAAWLVGVTAIVLLIACANVANLLLARGLARQRELAVRGALGVPRSRLVTHLLAETLIMTSLGGVAALGIANGGASLMRRTLLTNVDLVHSAVSGRVFAFTALATLLTGLVAGLMPALRAVTASPAEDLRTGGNRETGRVSLLQSGLVVAQGVLSVVLLTGAGLFVRSLDQVQRLDLGFQPDDLGVVQLSLESGGGTVEERRQFHARALEEIQRIPGVTSASVTSNVPFAGSWSFRFVVPGVEFDKPSSGGPYVYGVSPDHLETLGMRLVRGRAFTADDDRRAAPVAIVTEGMARGIWRDSDPVGQCIVVGPEGASCREVVGVVADMRRQALVEDEEWLYYLPLDQVGSELDGLEPVALMLRSPQLTRSLAEVQRQLADLPTVEFARALPFRDLVEPQTRAWRLGATMFTIFGALAVLIAGVGLYSVLAFSVARRRREFGIRSALGALPRQIVAIVVRQALGVALISGTLGLLLTVAAGPAIESLLFEVSPRDPVVLGAVAGLLVLGAIAAALRPALRAADIDPDTALRSE